MSAGMTTTATTFAGSRRLAAAAAATAGLSVLFASGLAAAQPAAPYPTRALRMIAPFPPGGGTDQLARTFAMQIAEGLGQPVTVENRAGAGGNLGAEATAKAAPDGYTIMLTSNSLVINAALYQKLTYNVRTDIAPVALVASAPLVVIVHPSLPMKNMKDLVAWAKRSKGGLNFGTNGAGTSGHLSGELLRLSAGIEMTHIPYKGAVPMMTALMGGDLDMGITTAPSALPLIRAGRLRALAVTTPNPAKTLPGVDPIAATFPGYSMDIWYGIFAPGGTPAPIQERLVGEVRKAHGSAGVRAALERDGADPVFLGGSEFVQFFVRDLDKYIKLVKQAGVKAEQ